MNRSPLVVFVAAALVAVTQVQARSYLIVGSGNKLPAKLESAVSAAGGSITQTIPQIGLAVVESGSAQFAASAGKIAGVDSVLLNVRWKPSRPAVMESSVDDAGAAPASHTTLVTDRFAPIQWGLDAVDAAGAWAASQKGQGALVAILDSGIASSHVDLAPNLVTSLSTSFVPGEAYNYTGTGFNHGTHVAGIIAAAANNNVNPGTGLAAGVVGIAPEARIFSVKVLSAVTGSGSFSGIIQGMVYAADNHADLINMSLGAEFPRTGFLDDNGTPDDPSDDVWVGAQEVSALVNALSRATSYAYQSGTTIIVSAGNSAIDRDHDGSYLVVPADCAHVIAISATAPIGWALDPANTFLDNLASYSNYGQSRISFAAPGGDASYPDALAISTIAGVTQRTYVFDFVFSCYNVIAGVSRWGWAAGTSMAAPHATGVAAIIIGRHGHMKPSAVEAALRASADDLGKSGNDDAYGLGRVNAARAATQ